MNISNEVSGSVRIKKDGLYLSISPITATHQGQYVCLVNNTNMDILRTYNITVTGGKHAVVCIFFIVYTFENFEKPALCMWHDLQHLACVFL